MYGEDAEDVFYYLTVYNEPYPQPADARARRLREGILRGIYRYAGAEQADGAAGADPRLRRRRAGGAARRSGCWREDWGVAADVWSVTSLERAAPRRARLRGAQPARTRRSRRGCRTSRAALPARPGRSSRCSDWMRAVPDQIAPLGARRLHLARHRRLRPVRHPRRAAPALPRRRRVDRGRGAVPSWPRAARSSRRRCSRRSTVPAHRRGRGRRRQHRRRHLSRRGCRPHR